MALLDTRVSFYRTVGNSKHIQWREIGSLVGAFTKDDKKCPWNKWIRESGATPILINVTLESAMHDPDEELSTLAQSWYESLRIQE